MSTSQRAADIAAGTSVIGASTSWVAGANEVLSLIGTLIAIFAGIGAIVVHSINIRDKLRDKK